jgi:hypothetical protein
MLATCYASLAIHFLTDRSACDFDFLLLLLGDFFFFESF